ncbi:MAG: cytochrome P450 [Solirubrobacteraceae bacterium]
MLPPGPSTPSAVQTWEWLARPTTLLRRCAARYGEPFTLRTAWTDAPMVVVSDPAAVRAVFTAPVDVAVAGASSTFLEPFVGTRSILVLDGPAHLRQRKLMLPPFHGDRMRAHRDLIAELAAGEVERWPAGTPFATHGRMQALTLDIIMRVVFGAELPGLRTAIRRTLDMTMSLPRMLFFSLTGNDLGFRRALDSVEAGLTAAIRDRRTGAPRDAILDELIAAGSSDDELRDQLVTLLAAGHETTAGSLSWALERLARHPGVLARLRDDEPGYADAVVKEVLRTRPVLTIAARKLVAPFSLAGWELPAGVHVAPCIYLTHRRSELYADPTAFRPERFLVDGAPDSYAWIPFGGGVRRCVGAGFAAMEMREVLRAVAARVTLRPGRPTGERMRRRSLTLLPEHGGSVITAPLLSDARCRSSAVTTA